MNDVKHFLASSIYGLKHGNCGCCVGLWGQFRLCTLPCSSHLGHEASRQKEQALSPCVVQEAECVLGFCIEGRGMGVGGRGGGELKGEGDIAYALKQGCGITNACTWVIHPWQPHKRSCLLQSVGIRKR